MHIMCIISRGSDISCSPGRISSAIIFIPGNRVIPIGSRNNKIVFRLLIRTRNYGNHNLVINLNERWDKDFIDDETKWLIKMGAGLNNLPLVENFGGHWPEYNLYTEEYIQGETLNNYLKRNENDINEKI